VLLRMAGLSPELVVAPHGEGAARIRGTDGALVIGDAAFGLADRFPFVTDLGELWFQRTGLPMVFAVWAARPGVLGTAHVVALQHAKAQGLKHVEDHARTYARELARLERPALPEHRYADYLRRSIRYGLDSYEREGLVEFLARARELGLVDIPGLSGDDEVHVRFAGMGEASLPRPTVAASTLSVEAVLGRAAAGERLTYAEGLLLYDQADLVALGAVADARRKTLHPDDVVTYIIDRNVNYTNVCTARCKFCNFYTPPGGRDGYVLTKEQLAQKFAETEALGGVQILLQGGLNPDLKLEWYEDLFRWTKENFTLKLHALSPTEIIHLAHLEDLTIREVLVRLRDAGMDSLPGGGAEMLHDEIRNRISPFKNTTDEWIEVMRQAHILGMKTTCTMVFGFQETGDHVLTHLDRLRSLQDESLARANGSNSGPEGRGGSFTAFITWPLQAEGTRLKLRDDTSPWRYLRLQALARVFLDNIPNIQVSWPTLGPDVGEVGLRFGANDFGSVMIEENVVSTAGAHFMLTAEQIEHHIRQAGFRPARRNMQYEILSWPS
jgi:cyclic dehypoxanthinyl futalosine synthase